MATTFEPCLSVIVVVYNNSARQLDDLLSSFANGNRRIEFIFVINGDSSNVSSELRQLPNCRVIEGHGNVGFGRGVNLGVLAASAPRICIINPDAKLQSGVDVLINECDKWPHALVGGLSQNPHGIPAFGRFPTSLMLLLLPSRMYAVEKHEVELRETGHTAVDWIEGSFLLCRRELWFTLGGFDPEIFLYGEDLVLSSAAARKGIPRIVSSSIIFDHAGGYVPGRAGHVNIGLRWFLVRHFAGIKLLIFRRALDFVVALKILLFVGQGIFRTNRAKFDAARSLIKYYQ